MACPFLFYLFLTPRFQWVAPPVAVLLFLAARAVARRRHRTALVMVAPYVGLAAFWHGWWSIKGLADMRCAPPRPRRSRAAAGATERRTFGDYDFDAETDLVLFL